MCTPPGRDGFPGYGPPVTAAPGPPPQGLVVASARDSVARLRRYALEQSTACGFHGDQDVLVLLVSEIATNAILHGAGDVRIRLLRTHLRLRVEVGDDSIDLPAVRTPRADAEGGRGLALVEALSDSWGTDVQAGGKTVWFELLD